MCQLHYLWNSDANMAFASYYTIIYELLNDDVTLRWLHAEIIQFFSHA